MLYIFWNYFIVLEFCLLYHILETLPCILYSQSIFRYSIFIPTLQTFIMRSFSFMLKFIICWIQSACLPRLAHLPSGLLLFCYIERPCHTSSFHLISSDLWLSEPSWSEGPAAAKPLINIFLWSPQETSA